MRSEQMTAAAGAAQGDNNDDNNDKSLTNSATMLSLRKNIGHPGGTGP
jgi:hypothetical protein